MSSTSPARTSSRFIFLGFVVLTIATATHIASVLLMPHVAPKSAYQHFATTYPAHHLFVLDPQTEHAPFDDPALLHAVCVFDLSDGPVRLRGPVAADELVTMSMQSDASDVFYSLTDRSAQQGRFDIILLTQAQLDRAEASDNEDEPVQEQRILTPSLKGFIYIQTLMERPSSRPEAQARLSALTCAQERAH